MLWFFLNIVDKFILLLIYLLFSLFSSGRREVEDLPNSFKISLNLFTNFNLFATLILVGSSWSSYKILCCSVIILHFLITSISYLFILTFLFRLYIFLNRSLIYPIYVLNYILHWLVAQCIWFHTFKFRFSFSSCELKFLELVPKSYHLIFYPITSTSFYFSVLVSPSYNLW